MRTHLPSRIRYGVGKEMPGRMLVCQVVIWSLTDATCDKKGGHSYFGHIGNMPPDGSIMRSHVDGSGVWSLLHGAL